MMQMQPPERKIDMQLHVVLLILGYSLFVTKKKKKGGEWPIVSKRKYLFVAFIVSLNPAAELSCERPIHLPGKHSLIIVEISL